MEDGPCSDLAYSYRVLPMCISKHDYHWIWRWLVAHWPSIYVMNKRRLNVKLLIVLLRILQITLKLHQTYLAN